MASWVLNLIWDPSFSIWHGRFLIVVIQICYVILLMLFLYSPVNPFIHKLIEENLKSFKWNNNFDQKVLNFSDVTSSSNRQRKSVLVLLHSSLKIQSGGRFGVFLLHPCYFSSWYSTGEESLPKMQFNHKKGIQGVRGVLQSG